MDLYKYWEVTVKQDADEIKAFFHENAWVNWHNTNSLHWKNISGQTVNIPGAGMHRWNGLRLSGGWRRK